MTVFGGSFSIYKPKFGNVCVQTGSSLVVLPYVFPNSNLRPFFLN